MSTKFYDAYRCPSQNLSAIMEGFLVLRSIIDATQRHKFAGLFRGGIRSQHQIDHPEAYKVQRRGWSTPSAFSSSSDDLTIALNKAQAIMAGERGESYVCSAIVYDHPLPDGLFKTGQSIVQFFGLERDIEQLFGFRAVIDGLKCTPYEFYDNTNGPEDVSEKDWEKRKEVVEILSKRGVPSKGGLSYDFLTKEEALEILWTEFARKNPPKSLPNGWPTDEERKTNDRFFFATPEIAGMHQARDYHWSWHSSRKQPTLDQFERAFRERFNPVLDSLDSAYL